MTAQPPSPLASPGPWDLVAAAYTEEVVPQFELFAREAIKLANLPAHANVVDVACGPGTLTFLAANDGHKVSALDFSPKMIESLKARTPSDVSVDARVGDGMALPYDDASFDAGFSMFGLMFFPNRDKGFRELLRVLKMGGAAVVSSWLPMDRLPLMSAAFVAVNELLPPPPNTPPFQPPLAAEDQCKKEMTEAGFRDVEVHEVTFEETAPSTSAFWAMLERSSAPFALRKQKLGDEKWNEVSKGVLERLLAKFGDGPQTIRMPAYVTVGRR
jgi:SAM-dependent methyltransferase